MKRILIALLLCLVLVGLMVSPVMAAPVKAVGAVKVDLCTIIGLPSPPTPPELGTVVGSVILNTTGSGTLNVLINVDRVPNIVGYSVRVIFPDYHTNQLFTDVLNTNAQGQGNVQLKTNIPASATGDKIAVMVNIGPLPPPVYSIGLVTVPLK